MLSIDRIAAISGFDRKTARFCWAQARAGHIARSQGDGRPPCAVITLNPKLLSSVDRFGPLYDMWSEDGGEAWSSPREINAEQPGDDGVTRSLSDVTPTWHAASGGLLATGKVFSYRNDRMLEANELRFQPGYTIYQPQTHTWTPWRTVRLPDDPMFAACAAGCTQRLDMEDGNILLPVYLRGTEAGRKSWEQPNSISMLRCGFDGRELRYLEHGPIMTVDEPRGLSEPSLIRFGDEVLLTARGEHRGFNARSKDGLSFHAIQPWTFDDGSPLGSYCTQQHWLTVGGRLFLVYTRKGANNDHVFRHRAPLFIGEVDPRRLCVIRDTERELAPNRGARMGNFGVCHVSESEAWVVVAEWMEPAECERHGSDNTVWFVKVTHHPAQH